MKFENRNRSTLLFFLIITSLVIYLTFEMIAPYILAIFMGALLTVLMNPIHKWLMKHKISRKWSALITTLAVIFIIVGPMGLFASKAIRQGIEAGQAITENPEFSMDSLSKRLSEWGPVEAFSDDAQAIERNLRTSLQNGAKTASAAALGIASKIPELLLQLALVGLTLFFLLVDGPLLMEWFHNKIPLDKDVRKDLSRSFQNTSVSVVWATLAAAGVQSIMMAGAYLALGVPAIFLAAGATFIFAWIPVIGSTPVWLAGAGYLYLQGSIAKAIIMIVWGLVTSITDNFVRPLVLKGRSEMHPLVSLIAIFGGIHMFGIFGVFIGPIVADILISLLTIWPSIANRFEISYDGSKDS